MSKNKNFTGKLDSLFGKSNPESTSKQAEQKEEKGYKRSARNQLKEVYVTSEFHQKAKVQAAKRGMKLRQYIEFLIEQDGQ